MDERRVEIGVEGWSWDPALRCAISPTASHGRRRYYFCARSRAEAADIAMAWTMAMSASAVADEFEFVYRAILIRIARVDGAEMAPWLGITIDPVGSHYEFPTVRQISAAACAAELVERVIDTLHRSPVGGRVADFLGVDWDP